ncbi:hypothetical protein J3A83DRAFT_2913375 [Scleroderma citrinum]
MDTQSLAPYVYPLQAPFIGAFISLIFYGVSCVQTFFYFQTYPDDHVSLKCLVAVIWILETAHSGFAISWNNHYLIDRFGEIDALDLIAWDFVVDCEIGFFITLLVNLLFIWRVWAFSKKVWPVCILLFLEISRYIMSTVTTSLAFHVYVNWGTFKDHAYVALAVTMGVAALADSLIASILAYYLHSKRTQRSTRLITHLLAYIVGTGALTSILSILQLITITTSPNSLLFVPFSLIQIKIYANAALLSLNLRQYQRKPRHSVTFPNFDSDSTPDNSNTSLTPKF